MRILLIEDNEELADLTVTQLRGAGFSVDCVDCVEDALSVVDTRSYSVVILDLGLPDGDGLKVLRHMRNHRQAVPVLILSARGTMENRVQGLDQGADDYLVKPFAFEELKARIGALLRRPGALLGMELALANLAYDTESRQASVDGAPLRLSAREAQLLELLMRRQDKVVPKASVENELFGLDDEFESNAVEVYVHRLRKRLQEGRAAVAIHTVRGVGYMLAAQS